MNQEGLDRLLATALIALSLFVLGLIDLDRVRYFCGNVVPADGQEATTEALKLPLPASISEIAALGFSVAGIVFSTAAFWAPNIPLPGYREKLAKLQAVMITCGLFALGSLLASVSLWFGLGFLVVSAVGVATLLWMVRPPRMNP